ncbi:MAG: thermonuclease family protein [Sphingomonadales bacterium]|nr:thermonuclease family protein [Sphingomonadales bacterium]
MISKFFIIVLLFCLFFTPFVAVAQGLSNQPAHMTKTVSEIMPDGTLVLEGGSEIILSGIRWWTLFGGDGNTYASPKDLLEKYISDMPVNIYLEPMPKDRYGRVSALVVTSDGVLIQQDLLQTGQAMFWPNSAQNEMLREAETQARNDGVGRWGWPSGVVKCHNWDGFWTEGMAIVKGRVKEVREFDSVTYINFGEVWWQDFTIKINNRWARENSFDAHSIEGQEVEVRGWLFWQGGPQILLEHKAQITPQSEGGQSDWAACPSLVEAS